MNWNDNRCVWTAKRSCQNGKIHFVQIVTFNSFLSCKETNLSVAPSAEHENRLKFWESFDHRSRKQPEWSMEQFVREMTTNNLSQSAAKRVTRPTYICHKYLSQSVAKKVTRPRGSDSPAFKYNRQIKLNDRLKRLKQWILTVCGFHGHFKPGLIHKSLLITQVVNFVLIYVFLR